MTSSKFGTVHSAVDEIAKQLNVTHELAWCIYMHGGPHWADPAFADHDWQAELEALAEDRRNPRKVNQVLCGCGLRAPEAPVV